MSTFRLDQLRLASVPYGLRLVFALVLAVSLIFTLNTAQPLNVTFEHDAGIASFQHQMAHASVDQKIHAASDTDQDQDGTSGAVHIHAHCGCHTTYAFQSAEVSPDTPNVSGPRFALTASPLASRDPPPLPEPPRA